MRVAFFGTPGFAVPTLRASHAAVDVAVVVTQPDRPRTRSHSTLLPSPVKQAALDCGIPVLQPERPRGDAFLAELQALDLDLGIVVAYGHLLPPALLEIPRLGLVNVHASLLPRWRGAAPIHWALLAGDSHTGVSIMRVEAGLDSGAVWRQEQLTITSSDTTGSLFDSLANLGATTLVATLPAIANGARPLPQDDATLTLAPKIDRGTARIDWTGPATAIACRIRAMDPLPGAWTTHGDQELKLFAPIEVCGGSIGAPGHFDADRDGVRIATGDGHLRVTLVQPSGRRRMAGVEWFRGLAADTPRVFV